MSRKKFKTDQEQRKVSAYLYEDDIDSLKKISNEKKITMAYLINDYMESVEKEINFENISMYPKKLKVLSVILTKNNYDYINEIADKYNCSFSIVFRWFLHENLDNIEKHIIN